MHIRLNKTNKTGIASLFFIQAIAPATPAISKHISHFIYPSSPVFGVSVTSISKSISPAVFALKLPRTALSSITYNCSSFTSFTSNFILSLISYPNGDASSSR